LENLILLFLTSFLIALSGALMPGPMLTVTIADSSQRGFWVGPLVVLGHGFLELVLIFLILAGLGPLLHEPHVIGVIGLAGGLVLLWLGISMVRNASKLQLNFEYNNSAPSRSSVLYGILASLSNPYWTLWWATIGMGYLVSALKFGVAGILIFFVGHIFADLAWYSAVSYAVSRGRRLISNTAYQRLILICGIFLALFGIWFFYFGSKSLININGM
jgi:threonine/homoserine/homoserine lactone efflux protein